MGNQSQQETQPKGCEKLRPWERPKDTIGGVLKEIDQQKEREKRIEKRKSKK